MENGWLVSGWEGGRQDFIEAIRQKVFTFTAVNTVNAFKSAVNQLFDILDYWQYYATIYLIKFIITDSIDTLPVMTEYGVAELIKRQIFLKYEQI